MEIDNNIDRVKVVVRTRAGEPAPAPALDFSLTDELWRQNPL